MSGDPRTDVTRLLDDLEAAHAAATTGPWKVRDDGVTVEIEGTGRESVRDRDGFLDADAALIVAAVNALPQLLAAVRAGLALADEWDTRHSDWCCQRGCVHMDDQHPGPVEFTTEGGLVQIGPDVPCPGACTCEIGRYRDGLRAAITTALAGQHTTDEEADRG